MSTIEHDPECLDCEHDCPWRRHHFGAPYCQVCDDHSEAKAVVDDETDSWGNPICGRSFMAGAICTDAPGHPTGHSCKCQNCGGDWYSGTCTCNNEPHSFELREDKWWCLDEDVISEECTDYSRCESQCVCNEEKEEE